MDICQPNQLTDIQLNSLIPVEYRNQAA